MRKSPLLSSIFSFFFAIALILRVSLCKILQVVWRVIWWVMSLYLFRQVPEGFMQGVWPFIDLLWFSKPSWIFHGNYIVILRLFKFFFRNVLANNLLRWDIWSNVWNRLNLRIGRRHLVYEELQDKVFVIEARKGSTCSLNQGSIINNINLVCVERRLIFKGEFFLLLKWWILLWMPMNRFHSVLVHFI